DEVRLGPGSRESADRVAELGRSTELSRGLGAVPQRELEQPEDGQRRPGRPGVAVPCGGGEVVCDLGARLGCAALMRVDEGEMQTVAPAAPAPALARQPRRAAGGPARSRKSTTH